MNNLLLHICCGVCAGALVEKWQKDGLKVTGYFYNPNIHPYQEFQKRLRAVELEAERDGIKVHYDHNYGLNQFLKQTQSVMDNSNGQRCTVCYAMRLNQTARYAREHDFDTFSSTLIISPQQNQELLQTVGERIARENGLKFRYEAVTDLYNHGKELAKKRSLYRQQYCGCIFSEYERYKK